MHLWEDCELRGISLHLRRDQSSLVHQLHLAFEQFSPWRDIFEHPFYSTLYPTHLHNRLNQMLKYWFSTFLLCQERGPSCMWWIFWPQSALDGAPIGLREHKTWSLFKTWNPFNLHHLGFHSVVNSSSSIIPSPSLRSGHYLGHFAFQSVLKLTRRFPSSFGKMTAEKSETDENLFHMQAPGVSGAQLGGFTLRLKENMWEAR